jgi:UDP-N-acetyl-2-amino-2-deoxyglucuronate dehydrogenase
MNKESKVVKFALIGCGRIAAKHADVIAKKIENTKLAAVCDIVETKAATFGEKYHVPFYTDYHNMLKKEDIDVVCILTESGSHAAVAIDTAKYRKHVVVEKPMALTLTDADAMIKACDENGVKLFVVKQNRYNLPVLKLKEAMASDRFGKIVMGTVRVRWSRSQEYYDRDAWRGTWAMDGGVFTNQASHHIDLLEWMLGTPVSVFAKSRTALVNIETEDTGVAVITFESGAIGVVEATTATRPKDLEGSITIMGEKGVVEIGGFAVNEMKIWNFCDPHPDDRDVPKHYQQNPPDVYGFGHIKYIENVVATLFDKEKALVDGLEGRKSLELISAIYESIETGKEVSLRFKPNKCRLGRKE